MSRTVKRAKIITVYLLLFLSICLLIYYAVKPAPTCFDGKQNQNEQQIDCGGVCGACDTDYSDARDLILKEAQIVEGLPGTYETVLTIENPNRSYGTADFAYTLFLEDAAGTTLVSRKTHGFILPTERKRILITNLTTTGQPVRARVEFGDVAWQEFIDYEKPELTVVNKRYNRISDGTGYSQVFGLLKNDSPYDFNQVTISIFLMDAQGKIIATNRTRRDTIEAFTEWDFRLVWPRPFPGTVDIDNGIVMEAETNMFDSQNFVKQYIPGGRFQNSQERF